MSGGQRLINRGRLSQISMTNNDQLSNNLQNLCRRLFPIKNACTTFTKIMSQLPGVSHSFAGIYFVCNKACTAVQDPVFVCTESYHGKWHVMFVSCIRARTILPHTKGAQLSLSLSVLVYMPPFYKLAFGSQVHVMHCIGSTFTHTHTQILTTHRHKKCQKQLMEILKRKGEENYTLF